MTQKPSISLLKIISHTEHDRRGTLALYHHRDGSQHLMPSLPLTSHWTEQLLVYLGELYQIIFKMVSDAEARVIKCCSYCSFITNKLSWGFEQYLWWKIQSCFRSSCWIFIVLPTAKLRNGIFQGVILCSYGLCSYRSVVVQIMEWKVPKKENDLGLVLESEIGVLNLSGQQCFESLPINLLRENTNDNIEHKNTAAPIQLT